MTCRLVHLLLRVVSRCDQNVWGVLPSAKRPEGRAARGRPGNVWQAPRASLVASSFSLRCKQVELSQEEPGNQLRGHVNIFPTKYKRMLGLGQLLAIGQCRFCTLWLPGVACPAFTLPYVYLTGDARPRFFDELCSRSGGDAREARTVGCKPTIRVCVHQHGPSRAASYN